MDRGDEAHQESGRRESSKAQVYSDRRAGGYRFIGPVGDGGGPPQADALELWMKGRGSLVSSPPEHPDKTADEPEQRG
jgi:hypothetical protein